MQLATPTQTTSRESIRVLVVDDHRTFADLLAGALTVSGMECVGTANSADEGVAMARDLLPDIVVMDIEMPHQDGLRRPGGSVRCPHHRRRRRDRAP